MSIAENIWHGEVPSLPGEGGRWSIDPGLSKPCVRSAGSEILEVNYGRNAECQFTLNASEWLLLGFRPLQALFQPVQWSLEPKSGQDEFHFRSMFCDKLIPEKRLGAEIKVCRKFMLKPARSTASLKRLLKTPLGKPVVTRFQYENDEDGVRRSVSFARSLSPHPVQAGAYESALEYVRFCQDDLPVYSALFRVTGEHLVVHFGFNPEEQQPSYPQRMIYAGKDGWCLWNRDAPDGMLKVLATINTGDYQTALYCGDFDPALRELPGYFRMSNEPEFSGVGVERASKSLVYGMQARVVEFLEALSDNMDGLAELPFQTGPQQDFNRTIAQYPALPRAGVLPSPQSPGP